MPMCVCVCVCFFFCHVHFKHVGCIFESCHIVDSLSALTNILLVCTDSFQSRVKFWCFLHLWDHTGLCSWCIRFYLSNPHLWPFSFFMVELHIFAWLKSLVRFLLGKWLEFLWVCLHDRYPQRFCIGQCL